MRFWTLVLAAMVVTTLGCSTTHKGAALGGLGGATVGGIIGHQSDHGVEGAAIGGAIGAIGGMFVGEKMDKKFCPECGRTFTTDNRFCPVDGTELRLKQ